MKRLAAVAVAIAGFAACAAVMSGFRARVRPTACRVELLEDLGGVRRYLGRCDAVSEPVTLWPTCECVRRIHRRVADPGVAVEFEIVEAEWRPGVSPGVCVQDADGRETFIVVSP
jgi:hypothetical protein